jgi:hypothetical protein
MSGRAAARNHAQLQDVQASGGMGEGPGITHYTSQGSVVGDTETTWAMGATDSFSQEAGQVVFFRSFFRSP